jgi:hypothetical protein
MSDFEKIVEKIGRDYVHQRMLIQQSFQYEFDTPEKRKLMDVQIAECQKVYRENLREKKLEHLLNDTILRK